MSRKNILNIFSSVTGRTTTTPRCTEPRIQDLAGFMPSYAGEARAVRVPTPTFRPDGFEEISQRSIRRLEGIESRRMRGRRGDL